MNINSLLLLFVILLSYCSCSTDETHMGTSTQDVVPGPLIPNAPDDLFAALGANDQKIYVIPSLNLVAIRCGESAGTQQLGLSSFDNALWAQLNEVID